LGQATRERRLLFWMIIFFIMRIVVTLPNQFNFFTAMKNLSKLALICIYCSLFFVFTSCGKEEPDNPNNKASGVFDVKGVSFKMVSVKGGSFTMGASDEQGREAENDEKPAHRVTLSDFSIGQTEVTQELWIAVMGSNPSRFSSEIHDSYLEYPFPENLQRPVECVSWNDCQVFLSKLNQLTGKKFRLPTEAEWEFAARGGNNSKNYKYAGSNDISEAAWFYNNCSAPDIKYPNNCTQSVGTKKSNELGLYDMSGNVCEWVQDWSGSYSSDAQTNPTGPATGLYKIIRGGSYSREAIVCRVTNRIEWPQDYPSSSIGLRLAL